VAGVAAPVVVVAIEVGQRAHLAAVELVLAVTSVSVAAVTVEAVATVIVTVV
jgi:hypothetical protein